MSQFGIKTEILIEERSETMKIKNRGNNFRLHENDELDQSVHAFKRAKLCTCNTKYKMLGCITESKLKSGVR